MDNKSIKDNIFRFRKAKGYTQEDMAALIGTSITTYRSIESGKTNLIHPMVPIIAELLDIGDFDLLSPAKQPGRDNLEEDASPYIARKRDSDRAEKMRNEYESLLNVERAKTIHLEEIVKRQESVINDLALALSVVRQVKILDNGNPEAGDD